MRLLALVFSCLFAVSAPAETCQPGDLSLYGGQLDVQADKTEAAPLYGASMSFGNQCFPVWEVQLTFGAKVALEYSEGKLDGQNLTITTVGAGPNWCFQFATGTGLCAAYLIKDSRFDADESKVNYGSQAFEYGVSQSLGKVVGKAAFSSSAYRTGDDTVTLNSYTLGLGYAL